MLTSLFARPSFVLRDPWDVRVLQYFSVTRGKRAGSAELCGTSTSALNHRRNRRLLHLPLTYLNLNHRRNRRCDGRSGFFFSVTRCFWASWRRLSLNCGVPAVRNGPGAWQRALVESPWKYCIFVAF